MRRLALDRHPMKFATVFRDSLGRFVLRMMLPGPLSEELALAPEEQDRLALYLLDRDTSAMGPPTVSLLGAAVRQYAFEEYSHDDAMLRRLTALADRLEAAAGNPLTEAQS